MKNYLLLCMLGLSCCMQTAFAQLPPENPFIPKEMQLPLAVTQVIPVATNIKQVHTLEVRKPFVVSVNNVRAAISKAWANCPSSKSPDATLVLTAEKQSSFAANLKWETKYAYKASGFSIEKSMADTFHFVNMYFAAAKMGKGNTRRYQLSDRTDYTGVAYFRVKQLDSDSGHRYSNIVSIKGNEVALFTIFPNPASVIVSLEIAASQSGKASIVLYDASGKIAQQQTLILTKDQLVRKSLNISMLPNGFYQVKVIMPDKTFLTQKIIKE